MARDGRIDVQRLTRPEPYALPPPSGGVRGGYIATRYQVGPQRPAHNAIRAATCSRQSSGKSSDDARSYLTPHPELTPRARALKILVVQVEIVKTIEVAHLGCSPSTFRGSVRQPLSCS